MLRAPSWEQQIFRNGRYQIFRNHQLLVIAISGLVVAIPISLWGGFCTRPNGVFPWDGVAIFGFIWFIASLLTVVVVVVRGDLQRPGFLRRAAHVIELTPRGIRLVDPIRGRSAEQADGSLHVARTNVYGHRGSLHGGLSLRAERETLVIHPSLPRGSWSGLPAAASTRTPLAVPPRFFDAVLRHAT